MQRGRLKTAFASGAISVTLLGFLLPLVSHPGEAVILVMPLAFGILLWCGWPHVRLIPLSHYAVYLATMAVILAGAIRLVAWVAGGTLLWREVFWALYFVVAWRMAWAVWKRTLGRLGEKYRRWGRAARHRAGGLARICNSRARRQAGWTAMISPARCGLVLFGFGPLLVGSLIHRIKIGNRIDRAAYSNFPIEEVSFVTADGLTISAWFLPERGSDSTVIVAHGSGAN